MASLLQPSDFTYLGYIDVQTNGLDTAGAQGLTSRYVGGDFRLMFMECDPATGGTVSEISLAGIPYGGIINSRSNFWSNIYNPQITSFTGRFFSLWWEESTGRLWSTQAETYTTVDETVKIYTRNLGVSNHLPSNLKGPIGLTGIPWRMGFGGIQPVPVSFQNTYAAGAYSIGWGGNASIVTNGISQGLAAFTFPDIAPYSDNTNIPAGLVKTLANHVTGVYSPDWYISPGTPTNKDRSQRSTDPINYYDGGDPRSNPPTPPNFPPVAGAQWLSPAPDGFGRFVLNDGFYNSGCWINAINKYGFIVIASVGTGKCYYSESNIHAEGFAFELHIFDPADLGSCANGSLNPWNVQPDSMTVLTLPGLGQGKDGIGPELNIGGATFDPVTGKLYLIGCGGGVTPAHNRIYVFQVDTTLASVGTFTAPPVQLTGSGTVGSPSTTGTGNFSAPTALLSGSGYSVITGSGDIEVPAATLSGSGSFTPASSDELRLTQWVAELILTGSPPNIFLTQYVLEAIVSIQSKLRLTQYLIEVIVVPSLVNQGSGLYFLQPNKTNDTLYTSFTPGNPPVVDTTNFKIPDPFSESYLVGED